jgi:vitamin K-dependent gamma-carboxylase
VILFLGYTLLFLMEKSEYINHLYLYCLISFWLIWMPEVKKNRLEAPAWYYYLMLFHISVVYFYAGIAKLNPDWLSGNTVRVMMNVKPSLRLFYAYGGLLFDLLIVPFLMWRRTRVVAFVAAVIFHITNVINFGLATFPWFSIMMTALYFGTSWPRKFTWFDHYFPDSTRKVTQHKWLPPVLVAYCLLQLFLPLRQHLYPGETSWTEDGHMFSWRMKLRTKTGDVIFYVVDKDTKKTQIVFPQKYLTKKQMKDMVGKPDSILQFAHYLKQVAGKKNVAVHASARVSLNGMPKREMLDVRRDLSQEERELGSYDWVLKQKGPEFPRALSYQD